MAQENPRAIETERVFLLHKHNTPLRFYCQLFFWLIESFFVTFTKGGLKMACNKIGCRHTSKSVASKASSILRDGRTSNKSKSVAGSALSQRKK